MTVENEARGTAAEPSTASPGTLLQEEPGAFLPEKHRVKREDGSFDLEASARKGEEHRRALERRFGMGDMRPKTADEYELEVPDEQRSLADALGDEQLKVFREKAHAIGLTPSQYNAVMGEFIAAVPRLAGSLQRYDVEAARATLHEEWGSDTAYTQNIARADTAIRAFAGDDAASIFRDYGSDPRIARMMAKIGAELGEGRAPTNALPSTGDTLDSLRSHPAYHDAKHPDHAKVSAQVSALAERLHGRQPIHP